MNRMILLAPDPFGILTKTLFFKLRKNMSHKKNIGKIEPFELFSREYDDWFIKNKDKYELELRTIRSFIPVNSNVMEVGVGSGKFAVPLGIKTGIDPSCKMAERAKKSGIKVIRGIAEELPFSGNCFDFILMVTTICFVDNIKKTFKEAARVLKKDGFIVIGFVDKESKLGKEYISKKDKSKFYKTANFFSTKEVLVCLSETGFENFEIKQTLFPENNEPAIKDGFGKGSFVVIKGKKGNNVQWMK